MNDHETQDRAIEDRLIDGAIGAAVEASRPALRRAYRLGLTEGLRRAANAAPVAPQPVSGPVAGVGQGAGNCGSCGRLLRLDGSGHVGVNDEARCDKPRPTDCCDLAFMTLGARHDDACALAPATSPTGNPTDA